MDYKFITIKTETIIGENENIDKSFFEYLDEYSISHKILEERGEQGWPVIEYTGGPIALGNMLSEKFGMNNQDIIQSYPQFTDNESEQTT